MWNAEQNIRTISTAYPNTYHVVLFACCREVYDPHKHQAFSTAEEAQKDLDEKKPKKLINHEEADDKSKQEVKEIKANRSFGAIVNENIEPSNVIFAWGCKPMIGVTAKTKMVKNFVSTLDDKFDRDTQMIQFPNAVKNIAAEDSNFEFLTSNTLMNCYLIRRKNIVTASKAIIFVNTHLRGLEYD